nr:MAG TPA: hypothetical protein [Caudoviricetes sp.]
MPADGNHAGAHTAPSKNPLPLVLFKNRGFFMRIFKTQKFAPILLTPNHLRPQIQD